MKKIILMLCTAVLCNSFNATIVNKVMTDFTIVNKEGNIEVWGSNLNYKRPLHRTETGTKTQVMNSIVDSVVKLVETKFIRIRINEDIRNSLKNALVRYLKFANRKAIYVRVPEEYDFENATDNNVLREKRTKDYTIIPVQKTGKNGGSAYIEVIAKRKNVLFRRGKVDHSHIIIKLTQPDANADARIHNEEEDFEEDD